jgi:HEAT repeat protein
MGFKLATILVVVVTCISLALNLSSTSARAEKVALSPEQLHKLATHIVVGQVKAIYSYETKDANWETTHHIAEVAIESVEKGGELKPGGMVYARYWRRSWINPRLQPPDTSGYRFGAKIGDQVRLYLVNKGYDGGGQNSDGGFNVVFNNGCEVLAKSEDNPAVPGASKVKQTPGTDVPSDNAASPRRPSATIISTTTAPALNAESVIAALKDSDPQIRIGAANDVRRLGSRAKEAVPSLIDMLHDKDISLQQAAVAALGQIGPNAKESIPAITEALSGDRAVREPAISAIARIGLEAKSATPALIALFDDPDVHIRLDAAKALCALGQSQAAEPALLDILKSTDDFVRLGAAATLRDIGKQDQACRAVLVEILESRQPSARSVAAYALGDYGRAAKESVPALLIALTDQSTFGYVREAAANALGKIDPNDPEVVKALTAAMKDKRKGVQKAAASALKKSG